MEITVAHFVEGLREAGEAAYRRALERLFGVPSARALWTTLAIWAPADRRSEWERVHAALSEVSAGLAHRVEEVVRPDAPLRGPVAWETALRRLSPHDHVLQFRPPGREVPEALRFLEAGLRRGFPALGLLPAAGLEDLRAALRARGHAPALDTGRLALLPLDPVLADLLRAGRVEPATGALEAALEELPGAGERPVWVSGQLGGRLFARPDHDLMLAWEAVGRRLSADRPLVIHCGYPDGPRARRRTLEALVGYHDWLVVGETAYPTGGPAGPP